MYWEIDCNLMFKGIVMDFVDCLAMNVIFVFVEGKIYLNDEFMQFCKVVDCFGVKGYCFVGGFWVFMYNVMEIESVQVLVQVMQFFEWKFGQVLKRGVGSVIFLFCYDCFV